MKHLEIALREYGVKEVAGDKHNPRIVQYSTDIGNTYVKTDEVAWCSEFVNWVLLQSGIPGTKSAVAKSFLTWGEETKTPKTGDIVVFGWDDGSGHIGFYLNETPTTVNVLGGNQSDMVNVTAYKKNKVLSYRKVPDIDAEREAKKDKAISLLQELVKKLTPKK